MFFNCLDFIYYSYVTLFVNVIPQHRGNAPSSPLEGANIQQQRITVRLS